MKLKKAIYQFKFKQDIKTALIDEGLVLVNGKTILNKEYDVLDNDVIKINDEEVIYKDIVNLVLYKPKGYLSANKDKKDLCVMDLLKKPYNMYKFKIAGRLDKDVEGLLILTTSGKFSNKIANPVFNIKKKYLVTLDKKITEEKQRMLLQPMILYESKDKKYTSKLISVEVVDDYNIIVELSMGKYHQVKKIIKYINYEVVNLKRIQVSNLTLKDLKPSEYYEFNKEELE